MFNSLFKSFKKGNFDCYVIEEHSFKTNFIINEWFTVTHFSLPFIANTLSKNDDEIEHILEHLNMWAELFSKREEGIIKAVVVDDHYDKLIDTYMVTEQVAIKLIQNLTIRVRDGAIFCYHLGFFKYYTYSYLGKNNLL